MYVCIYKGYIYIYIYKKVPVVVFFGSSPIPVPCVMRPYNNSDLSAHHVRCDLLFHITVHISLVEISPIVYYSKDCTVKIYTFVELKNCRVNSIMYTEAHML